MTIKLKYYFLLIGISYFSCNLSSQKNHNEYKNLLSYSDIKVEKITLIPCKLLYDSNTFLSQKENILKFIKLHQSCPIALDSLKGIPIITGYDENEEISWEEYKYSFDENFKVEYLGEFLIEGNDMIYHLVHLNSRKANGAALYVRELFLITEHKKKLKAIIKVGDYSDYLPDYSVNSFINYDREEFTYFEFQSLDATIKDTNKSSMKEYLSVKFRFDNKGEIIFIKGVGGN